MKSDSKTTSFNSKHGNLNWIPEDLLKNSNNIFYEHDLEGHFKFISPQINQILGYSPEEIKIKWQDMLTDNPINKTGLVLTKKAIETGEQQEPYEMELYTKDGNTKWFEIRESPVIEEGKTAAIIGALIDITYRKENEKRIIESEMNFRLLVENMSELIIKFDLEGRILYVSPNYLKIFDLNEEEIIGKKFMPEVHPEDGQKIQEKLEQALIEPFNVSHTERMKTSNGWRWFSWRNRGIINANGIIEELISVGRDITDYQNTNEELNKLALIAKETDNAVIIAGADRIIEWINEGFTRLTGYEQQEVIGKNPIMLLRGKETDENIIQRIIDASDKRIKINEELIFYKKNGEKYWAGISIQPIFTADGELEKLFSIHTDITERKNIEEALKESEHNYRLLVENQNEIIAKFDLKGCLNYVSPNYCSTFQVNYEDIYGQRYIPEVHPDDEAEFQKILDKSLLEPFDINFEVRMMTTNGWRWFEWSNRAIRIDNGPVSEIVTVGRDISERKAAEEELKKSEETSQALLNSYIDSALLLDETGQVIALNERTATHYDKSKEELIGVNIFDLMSKEIAEERKKRLSEAVEIKGPIRFEDQREGMWFDNIVSPIFDTNNKIFQYAVYAHDITARKNSEIDLKESEKKYQMLTEISPVGIFRTDPNGYTSYVNPRWCEISGMKAEDALGDGWLQSVFPEDKKIINTEWRNATKRGSKSTREYRFIRPDGSIRWVLGNAIPELNDEGEICGYIGTITDITEIRKAEDAIKEQHNLMRTMIDALPLYIFVKNREHKFVLANKELARHHNFDSPDELIGKTDYDLYPYEVADRYTALEQNFMELNEGFTDKVDQITDQYGKKEWWNNTKIPLRDIEGSCTGIVGIQKNITETVTIEEELRHSEERYRTIFDSSTSGIIIMDKDLNIIDANQMACQMYDYTFDEIKLLNIVNLTSKRTFEQHALGVVKTIDDGKSIEFEAVDVKKSGKEFSTNVSLKSINYRGETYILDIVTDITERKKAEESLKLSEEKFSKSFYLSPDSFTLTSIKNGKIIELNNGFEEIFGYSREEAIGKSTLELQLWKNAEDRDNVIKLIAELGRVKNYVAEYNGKDGKTGIGEVSMEQINISDELLLLTIVRDITEKKKNEKELKDSEQKFSAAFYSSMDAYAISNLRDGSIVDVNDVFCNMFEAERNEVLGKTTLELGIYKNKLDREKVFEQLKNNDFVSNIEAEYFTLKKKSGWAQFSINKINILDGVYLFISIRDITDQKEIQKEIEEYQKNLKVLSSELTLVEEKERRRIAVNLHDNLGQSLAMSKIKLAEAQREDDQQKLLEKLRDAKIYLDHSINNSRTITYELSPPVLHELGFSAALKWRFDQIHEEHGIQTEVKDNTGSTKLKDDVRILLFRSSMEIVNNTIKHASAKKIKAELSDDDDFFYVTIIDDGVGFDPITAEKEATKNKSFGLFSIRERISFLNGQLKIISEFGKGTSITIKIPNDSISHEGD